MWFEDSPGRKEGAGAGLKLQVAHGGNEMMYRILVTYKDGTMDCLTEWNVVDAMDTVSRFSMDCNVADVICWEE